MKKSKHVILWTICVAVVLMLAACGNAEDTTGEINNKATIYITTPYIEQHVMGFHEETFTIEQALYDLDYLLNVLENNFALFDVAYWARGVDIHALAENARREIETSQNISIGIFYNILRNNFASLVPIGHFFIHPSTHIHNSVHEDAIWLEDVQALTAYLNLNLAHSNVEDFLLLSNQQHAFVITDILEEGKIAYLAMPDFLPSSYRGVTVGFNVSYYEEVIFSFYEQIRDFEHLIIDLRGNRGGFAWYFFSMVIRPNIPETIRTDGFIFFIEGSYHFPRNLVSTYAGIYSVRPASDLTTAAEILENFHLPDFNMNDLQRLDRGLPAQVIMQPRRLVRFDHQPAFNGQIWLLTDGRMASASQLVATFVQESEFAILVGGITGGVYGGERIERRPLPHSGVRIDYDLFYVTDSRGRPLEAGTIPHHFNRPGMDALETALALIAEGEY